MNLREIRLRMSYQVLARKWRPQKFSQLVGQEHVVNAITNALENNKLHHAYLFTGTRGVGKTTIARIFSKSLNCEQGQSANPCGECLTCIDISDGRYVDLLEIDAASRTKVEDTRELLDNVQYRPTRGKYKVYLIDEVHMLSKHSFNALLKTLEEPPEHVKFLLATTDPQKLPVTILSRCLQFNLKALSKEQIQNHLAFILEQENINYENNAIAQLSKAAQGSIRDSLSLTDQAIAQGNNAVSFKTVASMLGLLNRNQLIRLLKFICERDGIKSLEILEDLCAQSPDYAQMLSQLLALIHQVALSQIVPDICKLENDSAKSIYTLANSLSEEHVQVLYQIGVNGIRDLSHAPDARTGLEMTILRMLAFSPSQKVPINIDDLISSDVELESDPVITPLSETTGNVSSSTSNQASSASKRRNEVEEHEVSKNRTVVSSDAAASVVQTDDSNSILDETLNSNLSQQESDSSSSSNESTSFEVSNSEQPPLTHSENNIEDEHYVKESFENDNTLLTEFEEGPDNQLIGDVVSTENLPINDTSSNGNSIEDAVFVNSNLEPSSSEAEADELQQEPSSDQDWHVSNSPDQGELKSTKSSYMRTMELLRTEKEIDQISNTGEFDSGSLISSKSVGNDIANSDLREATTDFKLGQSLKPFEGDLSAYLKNGDKLINSAQVDDWSAFVDSTNLQAYSRLFLLNTNCNMLSNPLKLVVNEDNYNMCTSEVRTNIEEKLSQIFNQKIELEVEKGQTYNTPYHLQQQIKDKRLAHAREIVNTDNNIQELKKAFDANVMQDSIEIRPKK